MLLFSNYYFFSINYVYCFFFIMHLFTYGLLKLFYNIYKFIGLEINNIFVENKRTHFRFTIELILLFFLNNCLFT